MGDGDDRARALARGRSPAPRACRSRGGWWARRGAAGRPGSRPARRSRRGRAAPGLRRSSGRRIASASRPKWASSVRASLSSMPLNWCITEPVGVERLRQEPDGGGGVDLALGGLERAEQQLQQRGLAGAVGAGDRDALAAVEREVDVAEDARAARRRDARRGGRGRRLGRASGARRAPRAGARPSRSTPSRARAGARATWPSWRPSWRAASDGARPRGRRCARCGGPARACRRCRPRACGGACPGPSASSSRRARRRAFSSR